MTTEIYLVLVEANKTIEELNQEIIELKHKAQQMDALVMAEKACDAVKFDKLQKENARLKESLEFYSDPNKNGTFIDLESYQELERENEAYRHSDKLLLDTLEQRENEILKLKNIIKKVCFDDDKQAAWDYLNKQGKEE